MATLLTGLQNTLTAAAIVCLVVWMFSRIGKRGRNMDGVQWFGYAALLLALTIATSITMPLHIKPIIACAVFAAVGALAIWVSRPPKERLLPRKNEGTVALGPALYRGCHPAMRRNNK